VLGLLWWPAVQLESVASFLVVVFCVGRVSCGGRISRMILIIASGLSYVSAVLAVARSWDLPIAALAIVCAAQLALLVSPLSTAVRGARRFRYGQRAGLSWCDSLRPGFCPAAWSWA
jgi:hypothetical protein